MIGKILWRRGPALVYPIPPAPRTAVLVPGFQPSGRIRVFPRGPVRVFPSGWTDAARKFAPQSFAGTLAQIEELARAGVPLTHALIVLGRCADPRLTETDRGRLWDAFHVPVFEQIIAEDCTLLAAECEAHDGLHIESPLFAPDPDQLEQNPCPCGRTTARIGVMHAAAHAR